MPRTAKANPVSLSKKSASELLDESGTLHDPVLVSQKTDYTRSSQHSGSGETSRITQVRRLAAPSANDESEEGPSET